MCPAQLGVIPDPDAPSAPAKPSKFKEAADKVCSLPLEKLGEAFPKLDKRDAPYACLDATYQHALLTSGFGTETTPFPRKLFLIEKLFSIMLLAAGDDMC